MPFVAGVRWSVRGPEAGRAYRGRYGCDCGRTRGASRAALRLNLYFAKLS